MIILGISWGFNSSCCLMKDGKVLAAQQEERFIRIKNYCTWPGNAIKSCLEISNLRKEDIDAVVWAGEDTLLPHYFLTNRYSNFSYEDMINEQYNYWYPKIYKKKFVNYLSLFKNKINLKQAPGKKILTQLKKNWNNKKGYKLMQQLRYFLAEKELGIKKDKVFFEEHHKCHTFYSLAKNYNQKKKFLIFTLDGSGDRGINCTVSTFSNNKVKRIFETKNFILGRIYRHITLLLGMKWGEHEYKTMGLAPYSSEKYSKGAFEIFDKTLKIVNSKKVIPKIKDCFFYFQKPLSYFRFDGIAQGVQKFAEIKILRWFNLWIKKTNINNICYSGGVSMNVKANLEISKIKKIKSMTVMGSGTDDSLSIGACYAYANRIGQKVEPLNHLYLGYKIDPKEIQKFVKANKKYKIIKNPSNKLISKLLFEGKIIGRCKGNMEFGARALGNRSILADPSSSDTIKKINQKIKSRDFWMPFAPSVLEEDAKKYFRINSKCDYTQMSICVESLNGISKIIPAVLHPADNTARIHLVKKKLNSDYHDLIKSFKKLSGHGILLNTSLNLHGKPIAKNTKDCIEILDNSDIDGIQVENVLFLKV
jgi:carbamoyltransferase